MSLASIFDEAAKSNSPDDRRNAIRIAAICTTIIDPLPIDDVDLVHHYYADSAGKSAAAASALANVSTARDKLLSFCEPLKISSVRAAVDRLVARAKRESSVSGTVASMIPAARANEWTQEQRQAATLALSNPAQFPLAVDRLLEWALHLPAGLGAGKLTTREQVTVSSLAYQELTGDRDPDSVRNLYTCLNRVVCDAAGERGASAADNQRLLVIAQDLVQIIRTQQWRRLGLS